MNEPISSTDVSDYLFRYAKLLEAEKLRLEVLDDDWENLEPLAARVYRLEREVNEVRRIANHLFENGWPKY